MGRQTGETLIGKSFLSGNRMDFLFLRGKIKKPNYLLKMLPMMLGRKCNKPF